MLNALIRNDIFGDVIENGRMATIGITGGTGFVGRHLTHLLVDKGYNVVIFTRSVANKTPQKQVSYVHWNSDTGECDINGLKSIDAIVHLAGTGLANKRWTEARKRRIVDSRVKVTDFLVARLKEFGTGCHTFIAASAMGIYGPDRDTHGAFTETDPPYNDFLANTCKQWEASSRKAEEFTRTVILRFGIVMGHDDGAFPEFERPMNFGIVPIIGSGHQMISWIEIEDLARLIVFAIEHKQMSGVYNAVTPYPVSQMQLMQTIAHEKGGFKVRIPAPPFMLRLMLGEVAGELLKSCTVSGEKILSAGFNFYHPSITGAVKSILGK